MVKDRQAMHKENLSEGCQGAANDAGENLAMRPPQVDLVSWLQVSMEVLLQASTQSWKAECGESRTLRLGRGKG